MPQTTSSTKPSLKKGVSLDTSDDSVSPVSGEISIKSEFIRKSIHIASLSVPIVYYFIERRTALEILIPAMLFSLFVDIGRHYWKGLRTVVNKVFNRILREHERGETRMLLSGATFVLISAALSIFIFPKIIAISAFSVLIISDASSALFGRVYGKHPFLDKSREGTFAFIVSAWIVIAVTPKALGMWEEFAIGAIAAVLGGIVEAASVRLRFDDNLSVPTSVGFTMWGLYYLLDRIDPARYGALFSSLMHFR